MGDLGRTWWLWGVLLGLGSPDAHAVTYTLHRSSILTSRPSFDMRYRVELDPAEVTVKGPPLEQSSQFCSYTFIKSLIAADSTQGDLDTFSQHR